MKLLCEIVQQQDRGKAMDWASSSANWATLSTLCLHTLQGWEVDFLRSPVRIIFISLV